MVEKSLDRKIARIHADPSCRDFILADAKDPDLAFGIAAPGRSPEHFAEEGRFRSLAELRDIIRENVTSGLLDIMLMSPSTSEQLTIEERVFENSAVTPAARANDTTDIHIVTGSRFAAQPSRPFRSTTIDHLMCGKYRCAPDERSIGADLGLYSMTFNNDVERDLATLEAYRAFRIEAEEKGFRHFLEVFNPNACGDHCPDDLGRFLNDLIARSLGGVTKRGRPVFLKIPYHGPRAMEQLVSYDATLVVGILGGSAGTTFDAFHQLLDARKHGAKAALYGRMINNSEHQLSFIQHLRWIADGEINDAAEAVKSYHGSLQKFGVQPYRSLRDDLMQTGRGQSYDKAKPKTATSSTAPNARPTNTPTKPASSTSAGSASRPAGAEPDFTRMTPTEKVQWNLNRWKKILD